MATKTEPVETPEPEVVEVEAPVVDTRPKVVGYDQETGEFVV